MSKDMKLRSGVWAEEESKGLWKFYTVENTLVFNGMRSTVFSVKGLLGRHIFHCFHTLYLCCIVYFWLVEYIA